MIVFRGERAVAMFKGEIRTRSNILRTFAIEEDYKYKYIISFSLTFPYKRTNKTLFRPVSLSLADLGVLIPNNMRTKNKIELELNDKKEIHSSSFINIELTKLDATNTLPVNFTVILKSINRLKVESVADIISVADNSFSLTDVTTKEEIIFD